MWVFRCWLGGMRCAHPVHEGRAVNRQKSRFKSRVAHVAEKVYALNEGVGHDLFQPDERVACLGGLALGAAPVGGLADQRHDRILVRKRFTAQARWVALAQRLRRLRRDHCLHQRAHAHLVEIGTCFGQAGDGGKIALLLAVVDGDGQDVGHRALVKADQELLMQPFARRVVNLHLVQAGRQRFDGFERRGDFGVFLARNRGRHKNAQMAHLVVNHINDALAAHADFVLVAVGIDDPVQRLLRRRDVVAPAGKHDDGRANRLEIEVAPRLQLRLSTGQAVADKNLLDDPADFGFVVEVVAAPPALEFEERVAVFIDTGVQVVVFAEVVAAGIELFKVAHQMRAVKFAVAEVGHQERRHHTAQ